MATMAATQLADLGFKLLRESDCIAMRQIMGAHQTDLRRLGREAEEDGGEGNVRPTMRCRKERDKKEREPEMDNMGDGNKIGKITNLLTTTCRGFRGERALHSMDSLHIHHVAHRRLLHKLHAPTEEGDGYSRDRHIYLCRFERTRLMSNTNPPLILLTTGMVVGLILLITSGDSIRILISFDYQIFFNLLLPPIILSSGYELHQANFFRNIGTILTFAFAGTFLSAVVIGLILWIFNLVPGSLKLTLVDAISVGATLSATDPVTILAIFNTYKVDPKLYTIIFGESILNDAIAIVIFETAQRYDKGEGNYGIISFFEGTGIFLLVFFGSMLIGVVVGVGTALLLKFTYVRRFPKIESCLILLIAYATYFFSHGLHMSGKTPCCMTYRAAMLPIVQV